MSQSLLFVIFGLEQRLMRGDDKNICGLNCIIPVKGSLIMLSNPNTTVRSTSGNP